MDPGPAAARSYMSAETLHRTIVDTMADGVVVQDAEGRLVAVNPAAERMLGLTRDQMLGLRSTDPRWRAVRDDGAPFPYEERPAAVALRTGRSVRDVVIGVYRADGPLIWVSASAEPLWEPGVSTPRGVVVCFTDITRLRRAQDTLTRLIEMAPDATVGVAADGRITMANRQASDLFGYEPGAMVGMPVEDLVPARHRAAHASRRARYHQDPTPRPMGAGLGELRGLRRDGTEFPAQISLSSIETDDGTTAIAAVRDLTRLRRAEAERDRFFEHSVDLVGVATLDGRFVSVNPAFERVLGWTAEELTSGDFMWLVHPDDVEESLRAMAGLAEGRQVRGFVNRNLCRDGSYRHLMWNSGVDAETGLIYASASDVTGRMRTDEALRRERDHSTALLASLQDGVVVLDAGRRIVQVNRRFCEMTGLDGQDIVGWRSPLPHWPDEDRARLEELMEACLEGSGGEVDVTFLRPDRRAFPAIVSAAPVRDGEGEVIGIIETVKDVTERERIDRMKDEFISVVGHELRTPLSAVTAAVAMLAETPPDELADGGRRLLDIARRNGDRLVRLINDTLDLERMTAGKESLDLRPASLVRIVTEALDTVRPLAARADVRLVVGDMPAVDRLTCDAPRVVQVLTNYLSNAVKFSPAGERVEVTGARDPGEVRLSVADRGRGIPREHLERIFDRFAQVDASDRRQVDGTGLGLAIARAIAEMHGGRVWAESVEGRGSTFHLTLPAR